MASPSPRIQQLLSGFPAAELERLVETRRDLHRHPELAFCETRTASVVEQRLIGELRRRYDTDQLSALKN